MSRLPQLEEELAAAALRIHRPRWVSRLLAPVVAAAAAAAAAVALLVPGGGGDGTRPAAKPPGPAPPLPQMKPIDGTRSPRQEFQVGGTRYSAIGFRSRETMICEALREPARNLRLGASCLSARLTSKALERKPAHVFAAGGLRGGGAAHGGFARADVTALRAPGATVFLSEPWQPWKRAPIRFFYVFNRDADLRRPLRRDDPLKVQLEDGRTVVIRY